MVSTQHLSFDHSNIRVLHIEPTTMCNAACPQCARENINLYDHQKNRSWLTVTQIKKILSTEFIQQLDKMFACGIFGDPAASNQILEIFKFFRSLNNDITLGMNTNGGLRNKKWWETLGELLSKEKDYCVFSIDGLADTNHIYRRGVNFNRVIKNASAFINAGGSAHWDMLVFEHNEHQINTCEQLARDLGFSWFRAKVSKRFTSVPVIGLNPPKTFNHIPVGISKKIKCHAINERSLYLAATGELFPCCWIGSQAFVKDNTMKQLLATPNYQGIVDTWENDPLSVCQRNCSEINQNNSVFEQQWFRNVQLR